MQRAGGDDKAGSSWWNYSKQPRPYELGEKWVRLEQWPTEEVADGARIEDSTVYFAEEVPARARTLDAPANESIAPYGCM